MIDTGAIRRKVLELAIQGKLSEQSLKDGNSEELYELVQEKKRKLINEGKIKGEKPLPNITENEMIFDIPNNWKWVRLGDCVSVLGDGLHGTPKYSTEGEYYFVNGNNLKDGKIEIKSDTKRVDLEEYEKYKKALNDSTVFVSINGTIGNVAFYSEERIILGKSACYFNMIDKTWKKYIYWLIKSDYFTKYATTKATGVTIKNVSLAAMKLFPIPLPPLDEQKRITNRIDEIFNLLDGIDEYQNAYSFDMEVLKNKIIDAGIQGKLTEQLSEDGTAEELYSLMIEEKKHILKDRKGREDKNIKEMDKDVPYELPDNWKWVRFGEIGLFKKGPFGSALTKSMFVPKSDDTVKVYEQQHAIQKNSELGTYYITREYFDDKMRGFEVLPGDILVSCAGTIGETYILPDEIEQGIINQALMRVSLVPSVNKRFFQYYFDANLKKTAQEESNGSAIKNIPPFDVMKNWYFPLAPLKEQERIVEKIEELLALI